MLGRSAFVLWLGVTSFFIIRGGRTEIRPALTTTAIATVAKVSGSAVARPEGLLRWRDLVRGQELLDGERIATGRDGRLQLVLVDESKLLLGKDSQIQLTLIASGSGKRSFLVGLLHGTVAIETVNTPQASIVVRSQDRSFAVAPGERMGFFRASGSVRRFDPNGPWPIEAVPPPQKESLAQEGQGGQVDIEIKARSDRSTYWTTLPLSEVLQTKFEFFFADPQQMLKREDWRPILEINGSPGSQTLMIPVGDPAALKLSVLQVKRATKPLERGGLKEYVVSLRGGVQFARSGGVRRSFGDKSTDLRIITVGEVGTGPVVLGIDHLAPIAHATGSPWMSNKSEIAVDAAPLAIHLQNSDDLMRLAPFIRGATQLGLARRGFEGESGIFVIRRGRIIAQLQGPAAESSCLSMLEALQGDLVFKGSLSAFIDQRFFSPSPTKLAVALKEHKSIYALRDGKVAELKGQLTGTKVEALRVKGVKALFTEKVEVLAAR